MKLEREIWKPIKGWEGLYEVSNLGNVKSFHKGKELILKPRKKPNGYLQVILQDNGIKKCVHIHRLVAQAFIPNPDNLPTVNHIDENKENNRVDNLEWMTTKDNTTYSQGKAINQYTLNMEFVRTWESRHEAARVLNINGGNLSSALHKRYGFRKAVAGGFKWFFVNDSTQYIDQPLF